MNLLHRVGKVGLEMRRSLGLQQARSSKQFTAAAYRAASINRLTLDWAYNRLSADQEIGPELSMLRARSRDLVRNSAWGRRYVTLLANNVAGPNGIRLQGRVMRGQGLPNEVINNNIEAAWARWGQSATATVDQKLSFRDCERLAMMLWGGDGEVLIRIVPGFDNAFGFALQFLDPDQLDETFNRPPEPGTNAIRYGVEVDEWNRPVAYHLWPGHPSESSGREREVIPAEQIIHLYKPSRVAQTRGVPEMVAVMSDINMLRGYYEAELVQARVAAAKGGFFVRKGEHAGVAVDPNDEQDHPLQMDAAPGVFEELPPGMEFQAWTPEHPSTAFPEFSKTLLRGIASGVGISYAALTNDLSDSSFSSTKAGLLDERDAYRATQRWLIDHFHWRVYRAWVPMAVLSGHLDPRVERERYFEVEWQPRRWDWVDPEKEIKAAAMAIQNGLASRSKVLGEQGQDFTEVLDDLKREEDLAKAKGVSISAPVKGAPTPGAPASDAIDDDDLNASVRTNGNGRGRFAGVEL